MCPVEKEAALLAVFLLFFCGYSNYAVIAHCVDVMLGLIK
jgi:hypothetical protein